MRDLGRLFPGCFQPVPQGHIHDMCGFTTAQTVSFSFFPVEQFPKRILIQLIQGYFYRLHHSHLIKAYIARFLIKRYISLIKKVPIHSHPPALTHCAF